MIKIFILLLTEFISTTSFYQTKITNEICKHISAFKIRDAFNYLQAIKESRLQSIDDFMAWRD